MKRSQVGGVSALAVAIVLALPLVSRAAAVWQSDEDSGDAVPIWVKEDLPGWIGPYVGKNGLPEPWQQKPGPLGTSVAGIDRWQTNHFIVHRQETAGFLYRGYTPLQVQYQAGTLPRYEKAATRYTAGLRSDREKAVALLTQALPALLRHPTIPPCGQPTRADRNLDDESLLQSGYGWCNEQARVFVRLCQVVAVPARMIFLFYSDNRTGHVVAEFYADGRWSMADTSWLCVFPGQDGHLMSAAEAHETAQGRKGAAEAYRARFEQLLKLSDAEIGGRNPSKIRQSLLRKKDMPDELGSFGVLNYPLPQIGGDKPGTESSGARVNA